jgi:small conductance mechanosensitive channel
MLDVPRLLGAWEEVLIWLKAHAANIVIILVLAWLLGVLSKILIGRIAKVLEKTHRGDEIAVLEQEKRVKTIWSLFAVTVRVVIYAVAGLMILAELGINITALLAGAGIVGIALGFGAQSVVKDMLAGLFILIEDQYRIGDVVEVNAGTFGGTVEKMSIRTTWLRAFNGNLHIIPNGSIEAVTNYTHNWTRVLLDFGISYGDDIDSAAHVIKETALNMAAEAEWENVFLSPPEVLGVEKLDDSAVLLRLIAQAVPGDQWKVARELRRRVKYALEESGATIPFPQVTVSYLLESKEEASKKMTDGSVYGYGEQDERGMVHGDEDESEGK